MQIHRDLMKAMLLPESPVKCLTWESMIQKTFDFYSWGEYIMHDLNDLTGGRGIVSTNSCYEL